jgi:hypothetical protein
MPKLEWIKKVLVLGSGAIKSAKPPSSITQAAMPQSPK